MVAASAGLAETSYRHWRLSTLGYHLWRKLCFRQVDSGGTIFAKERYLRLISSCSQPMVIKRPVSFVAHLCLMIFRIGDHNLYVRIFMLLIYISQIIIMLLQ